MYPFMAKHLKLKLENIQNSSGEIDEKDVVVKAYTKFKMFNQEFPLPEHIVTSNDDVGW